MLYSGRSAAIIKEDRMKTRIMRLIGILAGAVLYTAACGAEEKPTEVTPTQAAAEERVSQEEAEQIE